MAEEWQRARIIPVVGTGSGREREQRATSALLAVLSVVRPFSLEVLSPLGASKAQKALVEAFVETPHKTKAGASVRPDGLIRVIYGNQEPWTALVEVKTNNNELTLDQINSYIDCARQSGYQHVITVSNEMEPSEGIHPTEGLRVRKDSRVQVTHFSWTRVAALAARVRDRTGVDDVEQEWILSELIRYLEHQSSGALEFDDMGENWTSVRDAARTQSLRRTDAAVLDIARRWDQLLTFAAFKLGIQIGEDVEEVMPRAHRDDAVARAKDFARELSDTGVLTGALRVDGSIGDIEIAADLRSKQLSIGTLLRAPSDKKARGSVSWLRRQLKDSRADTEIEAIARNYASGPVTTLGQFDEDPDAFLGQLLSDVAKFRVTQRRELSLTRRGGKAPGFVDSILGGVLDYYRDTHQNLTPYPSKAPQVSSRGEASVEVELGSRRD